MITEEFLHKTCRCFSGGQKSTGFNEENKTASKSVIRQPPRTGGGSEGALRMEIAAFETPPDQVKIAAFWMPHHMDIAVPDQMKIAAF